MDKKNSSDTHCSTYLQVFGKVFQRHKTSWITTEGEKIHEWIKQQAKIQRKRNELWTPLRWSHLRSAQKWVFWPMMFIFLHNMQTEQRKMERFVNANNLVREGKIRHHYEELQIVHTVLGDWEITYQVKSQYWRTWKEKYVRKKT